MIETLHLANHGAYNAGGAALSGLKQLNFVFGPNGSGKTIISRLIDDPASRLIDDPAAFKDCKIDWAAGRRLEVKVYNRDFVQRHFDSESSIKGVYTFGDNVEVAETIEALRKGAAELTKKQMGLKTTLSGEDGLGGKKKDRDDLQKKLVEGVWTAKRALDLDQAFTRLNNSKANFYAGYEKQAATNTAELRDIGELRHDAGTVYSTKPLEAAKPLPMPECIALTTLEASPIPKKIVIGKKDVDIAALIELLGNSDWVQQGREFYSKLEDQCPFCQQKTDAAFRQSLEEYFDASYIADLEAIDALLREYEAAAAALLADCAVSGIVDSPDLERQAFEKAVSALHLALESNIQAIRRKRKEPSALVSIESTVALVADMQEHIDAANAKVKDHNATLHNLEARKRALSAQIWRRLLEDSKAIYDVFKPASSGLDSAITKLDDQIKTRTEELDAKREDIAENERKITSIKPTLDAINKLLKSFGFINFYLAESTASGFYEVKRHSGDDAKPTLSEGEKSFITFLYFYHLIKGSFTTSGTASDRVVVFDDPVSSLDSDILFIVCDLIKGVVKEMTAGGSSIKQIFILTHNIYFHKEISFNKNRNGAQAMKHETFWIIRKSAEGSVLVPYPENPITSGYELLWREVRLKPPSETTIQNVMRRILEHYFKFFGGITPEKIIEDFDGQDKMICGSLLHWINDGSHFANDDLCMSCDPGQISRYLTVFRRIFEVSGNGGHYRMMMGADYVALPALAANLENPPANAPAEDLFVVSTTDSVAAGVVG